MHHPDSHHGRLRTVFAALVAGVLISGCAQEPAKPKPPVIKYTTLHPANLPPYLQGTVGELAQRTNDEPYATATFGLVGGLRGTGDTTASLQVREWMTKQMIRHGYGSKLIPGYDKLGPERVL